jgi:hypothetical protein
VPSVRRATLSASAANTDDFSLHFLKVIKLPLFFKEFTWAEILHRLHIFSDVFLVALHLTRLYVHFLLICYHKANHITDITP